MTSTMEKVNSIKMIHFSKNAAQYSLHIKIDWLLSHVFFSLSYFENILIA